MPVPILLAAWLLVSVSSLPVTADSLPGYSEDAYATCSACHLPDGVGIPGAFPPVRGRAAAIAGLDGGREYLATVVSYGLMGTIDVAGSQYFGVMAGNAGALSAEEIAAALNYTVFELNDEVAADIDPFTAEEIENVQLGTSAKSPATAGEMRVRLVTDNGDQWP